MKTADLTTWTITSAHGSDCADCRYSVRRIEDRLESGESLRYTYNIVVRYHGHDATASRND